MSTLHWEAPLQTSETITLEAFTTDSNDDVTLKIDSGTAVHVTERDMPLSTVHLELTGFQRDPPCRATRLVFGNAG